MSMRMALLSFLLLLSSSIQFWCLTEGRPFLKPQEAVTKFGFQGREATAAAAAGVGVGVAMIGSRPPRCEGRCLSCGQCKAVQVPAVPQEKKTRAAGRYSEAVAERDDGSTIYKPLSWKCKCGGLILDP